MAWYNPASWFRSDAKLLPPAEEKATPTEVAGVVAGRAVSPTWNANYASREQYKGSAWTYAAITRKARAASMITPKVEVVRGGRWEPVPENDPLQDLLDYPNSRESWGQLMERAMLQMHLSGQAPIYKARGPSGRVAALYALHPDTVRPVPGVEDLIAFYEFKPPRGGKQPLPVEDVIWPMFTDPDSAITGLSPLQIAVRTVLRDRRMDDYQTESIDRRIVKDGLISLKQPMNKEQIEAMQAAIAKHHEGAARGVLVLGSDATFTPFTLTPAELDYALSRGMNREEILAIIGVPPPIVGIYDNATLSNIDTARRIFYEDSVLPDWELIAGFLTMQLSTDFGTDFRIVPDTSRIPALRESVRGSAETANKLWQIGYSRNEVNERLGLGMPMSEDGRTSYIPSTMVPADSSLLDDLFGDDDGEASYKPSAIDTKGALDAALERLVKAV